MAIIYQVAIYSGSTLWLFSNLQSINPFKFKGDTITQQRVQFLFELFFINMLSHTSKMLAGGADNTIV